MNNTAYDPAEKQQDCESNDAFVAQPVDDHEAGTSDQRWADKTNAVKSQTMSTEFCDDDDYDDYEDDSSESEGENDRMKNLIPTSREELEEVEAQHGKNSWQLKAVKFINSRTVQHVLIALLLMDVLILFVELYLDAAFPSCYIIERDGISCCPADDKKNATAAYDDGHHRSLYSDIVRILASDAHHSVCDYPLHETDYDAGCDDHKYAGVHKAHSALKITTIVILSIFQIELLILLICLGPRKFFSHFMYVLDFFVVSASLGLEIAFSMMDAETLVSLAGLLVIARIWRFVRIGHGLVASAHELEAHKRKDANKYIAALEKELKKHGLALPEDRRKSKSRKNLMTSTRNLMSKRSSSLSKDELS